MAATIKLHSFAMKILITLLVLIMSNQRQWGVDCSLAMKRLYEDLFTDYNRLIVPVSANKTKVTITLGLKLGQILDLNLKQQILSTNVWVEQTWYDHRLEWEPQTYDGIDMIHVPAENIWIPDIVLFNNADGNYELTLVAKALLYSNGTIVWKPPTMFRSTCEIDVEYFPFDIQTCFLRFGSWTYAGDEVEIKHVGNKRKVDIGIDLSVFYKNVEWDIIDVPAYYNENYYECCSEPFPDITFKIVIRRKMLFYLVNLILPVALMTFMTVSVFYLPADSNEKVTLSISILTSLIVFFLLMLEVIPPTSLAVPLFGKYLLFTLVLVSLSACVSVYVLNIYHRAPSTHQMSPRMRQLFLKTLPRLLRLDRPDPRERSSLNRFRKKKIAQQILQARQHNKVYDLAQPLAASLNLIDTLQRSYTFNPRDGHFPGANEEDDDDFDVTNEASAVLRTKQGAASEEEEGRYFRRYVDKYIAKLARASCACEANQVNGSIKRPCAPPTSATHCSERSGTCCPLANKPIRQTPSRNDCCKNASFTSRQNLQQQSLDHSMSFAGGQRLANLHDDTFDMTFDYDDQENNQNNANFESSVPTNGHMTTQSCSGNKPRSLVESDLPSPPPPPRQLTQLSDSMKDLSGRLSSCSQRKLLNGAAAYDASLRRMHSDREDVDGGEGDDDLNDGHQLVSKLINSINLINNASHEIDTTTTATNSTTTPTNDTEYRHFKSMARTLNSSNNNNNVTGNGDFSRSTQQQQHSIYSNARNICTCGHESPIGNSKHQQNFPGGDNIPFKPNGRENVNHEHRPPVEQILDACTGMTLNGSGKPSELLLSLRLPYDQMPDHVRAAIRSILFIADTIKNEDDENSAIEDWESMSMVVDRLFLWIFFLLCTFGSIIILALAPSLYDQRDSIDDKLRIDIPESNCSAAMTAKL